MSVGLYERKAGERQWQNGISVPQNDGHADVDEGHEDERSNVKDKEIDHGVDASVEWQSVDAERVVRTGCNDVVGNQPRQWVSGTDQPRDAYHHSVNCPISAEPTVQHRVLDGHVPLEWNDRQDEDGTTVREVLDEVEQFACHLHTHTSPAAISRLR